jgi:hypothetical protein
MRHPPALVLALFLCGCAQSPLAYDLRAADAACYLQRWPDRSAQIACLTAHERPVWARDDPTTLELFDGFAERRAELARQFDDAALSPDAYRAALEQTEASFRERIAARRESAPPPQ